jgi:hypothetical protein
VGIVLDPRCFDADSRAAVAHSALLDDGAEERGHQRVLTMICPSPTMTVEDDGAFPIFTVGM